MTTHLERSPPDAAKFSRWMDCNPAQHPCRWVWEGDGVRCKTCGSGFTQAGIEIGEELLERGRSQPRGTAA